MAQNLGQMLRVLIVLEGVVDVNGSFCAGLQNVRDGLIRQLPIHVDIADSVFGAGARMELGKREWVHLA